MENSSICNKGVYKYNGAHIRDGKMISPFLLLLFLPTDRESLQEGAKWGVR